MDKLENGLVNSDATNSEDSEPILSDSQLENVSKEQLILAYQQLNNHLHKLKKDNADLKESEEKTRVQQVESSRREHVLVMRLTTKEQELQEYVVQLNELKASIAPTPGALKSTLIDPAVNLIIQRMKKELEETRKKLEDTQNDLNAWKFTPDSNTGKRLMAKCKMLYQENEDLGKMITSGTLAKLESDLALQRSLTDEMKKSQSELDELIQELDEDVEGMQSTIYFLQQQLRESKSSSATNSQSTLSSHNNNSSEVVSIPLAELCGQCRTTQQEKEKEKAPQSPPPPPSSNTNNTLLKIEPEENLDLEESRISIENNGNDKDKIRTCVNGNNDESVNVETRTTKRSHNSDSDGENDSDRNNVQNNDCEDGDDDDDKLKMDFSPFSAKRTKLANLAAASVKQHQLLPDVHTISVNSGSVVSTVVSNGEH